MDDEAVAVRVHGGVGAARGSEAPGQQPSCSAHGGRRIARCAKGLVKLADETQARLALPQVAQRTNALGGLRNDAQHAADRAIRVRHGRVGHVEVNCLAPVAVPLDREGPVLGSEGLASLAHALQQWLQAVP